MIEFRKCRIDGIDNFWQMKEIKGRKKYTIYCHLLKENYATEGQFFKYSKEKKWKIFISAF